MRNASNGTLDFHSIIDDRKARRLLFSLNLNTSFQLLGLEPSHSPFTSPMFYRRSIRPWYLYGTVLIALFLIRLSVVLINDGQVRLTLIRDFSRGSTQGRISADARLQIRLGSSSNLTVCRTNDYLIIYVLSTVGNTQQRKAIRSTWGSKQGGVCFVFILGQTHNTGTTQIFIDQEKNQYHDIVQIDHAESYANLVYKEVAALQWTQRVHPTIPYLFKTDDDLIVDTLLVSGIARMLVSNSSEHSPYCSRHRPSLVSNIMSSRREDFFRGVRVIHHQSTSRHSGELSIDRDVWPYSTLPPYCSGYGWLMSKTVRDRLVSASVTYPLAKVVWLGDVFLSGFLGLAANIECTGLEIDFKETEAAANCSCLLSKKPMLAICPTSFHSGRDRFTEAQKYAEYQRAWNVIQLRHQSAEKLNNYC